MLLRATLQREGKMSEEQAVDNLFETIVTENWEKKVVKLIAKDTEPEDIVRELLGLIRGKND